MWGFEVSDKKGLKAFALPILQALLANPALIFALIPTPSRELAYKISEQFEALRASIGV